MHGCLTGNIHIMPEKNDYIIDEDPILMSDLERLSSCSIHYLSTDYARKII